LSEGQEKLLKAFQAGDYTYLYSFQNHASEHFQVLEIEGQNFVLTEKNGLKLFFNHRNPHYFRYFTKVGKYNQFSLKIIPKMFLIKCFSQGIKPPLDYYLFSSQCLLRSMLC